MLDSPDQQRRWRVNLAIRSRLQAMYALDGNAVAMVLDQPLLAELAARNVPPVLVLIGYDNDLRIDSRAHPRPPRGSTVPMTRAVRPRQLAVVLRFSWM